MLDYHELQIRNARAEDGPILLTATREITLQPGKLITRPHELSDKLFSDRIRMLADHPRGVYFVAEIKGSLIGHGYLDPMNFEAIQHVAQLSVTVHQGHHGKKVGERLFMKIIDWARTCSQLEKIEIQVRSTNTPAIALCQKVGFKEEGRWLRRVKLADDMYVDDILLGLWL